MALSLFIPGVSYAEKRENAPDAYVFVGHLDQTWYRQMIAAVGSALGNDADVYRAAEPLIKKKIADLEKLGYRVHRVDGASRNEFHKFLTDPKTRAVAWFGHGEARSPGSVTAFKGDDEPGKTDVISPGDLKEWAREKWARKNGWNGNDTPDNWLFSQYGHDEELLQAKRREINAANHGLEYGYFHTCYGFDNNKLAETMMKRDAGARAFGFKGIKVWFDEKDAQQAAFLKGKVEVGDPKVIEPKRQAREAILKKDGQARSGSESESEGNADPDLEEVSLKPAKSGGKSSVPAKGGTDPDLEEVNVRPRRPGKGPGDAEPAEGSGTGREKQEKDGADKTASPDLKPNLVRTSWSGEITVQEDGEPARVTPFSLSIDGAGKVASVFSLGIFAEDEAQGVREIRAEGRYVSKTGRLEMSFDRTFSKTNTQVTKVPDYAFDASGRLVQIGEHEERFSMILSLRAWGSLKGEADSDREMRGYFELNELSTWASPENPALSARYSDADPTRTAGTWRANRIN